MEDDPADFRGFERRYPLFQHEIDEQLRREERKQNMGEFTHIEETSFNTPRQQQIGKTISEMPLDYLKEKLAHGLISIVQAMTMPEVVKILKHCKENPEKFFATTFHMELNIQNKEWSTLVSALHGLVETREFSSFRPHLVIQPLFELMNTKNLSTCTVGKEKELNLETGKYENEKFLYHSTFVGTALDASLKANLMKETERASNALLRPESYLAPSPSFTHQSMENSQQSATSAGPPSL